MARDGEILASAMVRDIAPGSGLRFSEAGRRLSEGEQAPRLLLLEAEGAHAGTAQLSAREREILAAVARGMTNADIAADFRLSEHIVKRHVANILTKLDLTNRSAAAAFAVQHGLV